jgi:hypothetical protein
VELLNMLVVVVAAPAFAVSRLILARKVADRCVTPAEGNTPNFAEIPSRDQLDLQRISSFSLGICLAILLYFQLPINVSGTTLTLNLGDIFSLLGLGLLASQMLFGGWLNFRFGDSVLRWLALVTAATHFGLLVGLFAMVPFRGRSATKVSAGLSSSGILVRAPCFPGQFGRQGIRRLAEVLLLTAAMVLATR